MWSRRIVDRWWEGTKECGWIVRGAREWLGGEAGL